MYFPRSVTIHLWQHEHRKRKFHCVSG